VNCIGPIPAVVNTILNVRIPQSAIHFVTSLATIGVSETSGSLELIDVSFISSSSSAELFDTVTERFLLIFGRRPRISAWTQTMPADVFPDFIQLMRSGTRIDPEIRPQALSSTSFPFNYLLIILQCDTMSSELLTLSVNKSGTSKTEIVHGI
jgi:hypothetical protein